MENGEITIYEDKNGKLLKIGDKVKEGDGYNYEIIYCEALERVMISEPLGGQMFEIDDFDVELLPLADHNTDKAEQQLLGFFSAKTMNLRELVISMGLTKKEWEILKEEYPLVYMSEDEKHTVDLVLANER